ncbi:AHH domain-containing protein [Chryseobacterium scophthalmum]|uniref:A nuclease family of the HNH/ENDO VII superfamily with conserved AHH n=1 Tax=Chryseobacterium scophthalmum TaxID=59733 RepID=A0A1N6FDC1_9FLAO|nr:AHH domain-containing protein [Chryseobacterium scophthalmum]SIN93224.1 A nuclease family of the HNH/ENDO VII superfamily with conserved AHH [Chryseobacterium scophthalmum]
MAKEFEQAHHLIPIELITNQKVGEFIRKAINGGFEFNGKINAKWLKQFSSKFEHLKDGVHASHPQYTNRVVDFIENTVKTELGKSLSQVSKQEAKEVLEIVSQSLDEIITVNKNMKINDIIF